MNILIVDDKKEGRYMLESLLKGSGHEVVCAENGIEALEMLRKDSIDMIISDILMPKMDGFAFCRECKSDDSLRKIPFIFYTATYTDKKDEEFALSLGAEKFIVKPTEPNKFLEILQGVIKEHKERTAVTAKKPAEEEVYLVHYNKRLIEKLEHKALNLEKELADRKLAEQKLLESEIKFRTLFEAGAEGILVADLAKRKFKYANPTICRMLGYTESELTTMGVDDIHPSEQLGYVLDQFNAQARGEKTLAENIPCRRKDGTIFYANISTAKAVMEGEECNIGFFTDVTNIMHMQEKLLDNQKRLKALAAELSLAEERERRRIAMGIHDDLGQKLAMAKFHLQALQGSVSDRNMRTALNNECILMDDILDDIHSLTFELSNPLLYEVGFESAVKSWLKTEIEKKAGLKCEFSSDGNKIEMDEDIKVVLFKAVRELLTNIIKHAKARTVKVGIAKQNTDVMVTVEDDGAGFDVSKLGLPSGTEGGFGLFSIKERLEYIGGQLEIESSPGKGTRIVMTAPVKKSKRAHEGTRL
jgi:PAS domain S-box-containing protein